jgi:transcriptional regulator with XRE-family HTH domain
MDDRAYISEVENGKRSLSLDRLLRLCGSLEVKAANVIADVEEELRKRKAGMRR